MSLDYCPPQSFADHDQPAHVRYQKQVPNDSSNCIGRGCYQDGRNGEAPGKPPANVPPTATQSSPFLRTGNFTMPQRVDEVVGNLTYGEANHGRRGASRESGAISHTNRFGIAGKNSDIRRSIDQHALVIQQAKEIILALVSARAETYHAVKKALVPEKGQRAKTCAECRDEILNAIRDFDADVQELAETLLEDGAIERDEKETNAAYAHRVVTELLGQIEAEENQITQYQNASPVIRSYGEDVLQNRTSASALFVRHADRVADYGANIADLSEQNSPTTAEEMDGLTAKYRESLQFIQGERAPEKKPWEKRRPETQLRILKDLQARLDFIYKVVSPKRRYLGDKLKQELFSIAAYLIHAGILQREEWKATKELPHLQAKQLLSLKLDEAQKRAISRQAEKGPNFTKAEGELYGRREIEKNAGHKRDRRNPLRQQKESGFGYNEMIEDVWDFTDRKDHRHAQLELEKAASADPYLDEVLEKDAQHDAYLAEKYTADIAQGYAEKAASAAERYSRQQTQGEEYVEDSGTKEKWAKGQAAQQLEHQRVVILREENAFSVEQEKERIAQLRRLRNYFANATREAQRAAKEETASPSNGNGNGHRPSRNSTDYLDAYAAQWARRTGDDRA